MRIPSPLPSALLLQIFLLLTILSLDNCLRLSDSFKALLETRLATFISQGGVVVVPVTNKEHCHIFRLPDEKVIARENIDTCQSMSVGICINKPAARNHKFRCCCRLFVACLGQVQNLSVPHIMASSKPKPSQIATPVLEYTLNSSDVGPQMIMQPHLFRPRPITSHGANSQPLVVSETEEDKSDESKESGQSKESDESEESKKSKESDESKESEESDESAISKKSEASEASRESKYASVLEFKVDEDPSISSPSQEVIGIVAKEESAEDSVAKEESAKDSSKEYVDTSPESADSSKQYVDTSVDTTRETYVEIVANQEELELDEAAVHNVSRVPEL